MTSRNILFSIDTLIYAFFISFGAVSFGITAATTRTLPKTGPKVAVVSPSQPTFEAYQKVFLGKQHAGFAIQRYNFDAKKKVVTSIAYTYVKTGSHSTIESTVAKCGFDFEPISYKYTALVDGKPVIIDATFHNKQMTAIKIEGKKKTRIIAKVPPSGFLSSFLNYVLLKNGLSVGKAYVFHALAEEKAQFLNGTAHIVEETKVHGVPSFKIKFKYPYYPPDDAAHQSTEFTSMLSDKGEALGTLSPDQDASTEIAPKSEATEGLPFNEHQIKLLFGNIPPGVNNQITAAKGQ